MLLSGKGFECTTATNGYEAFTHAKKAFYGDKKFDLVLLDLNMPVCSGYECCERIVALYSNLELRRKLKFCRELTYEDKANFKPIIIACSSHVNDEVKEKTARIGFDLTMAAPLKATDIEG